MKRLSFVLATLMFMSISAFAKQKSVSYLYKPFANEGCGVEYSALKLDSIFYMSISVESSNLMFSENPIAKFKFFNGEIIELKGKTQGNNSSDNNGGTYVGFSSTGQMQVGVVGGDHKVLALFPITREQAEKFNYGVQKVYISLVPYTHDRTFKKDEIGAKLWKKVFLPLFTSSDEW